MARDVQIKPYTVRVFITGMKKAGEDIYLGHSYCNLTALDLFTYRVFLVENQVELDVDGMMVCNPDQTWVDFEMPHRGGFALDHSGDTDDAVFESFYARCKFEDVEKYKRITGINGPVKTIESASITDYMELMNRYGIPSKDDGTGWGEDTYAVMLDKYRIDRETVDVGMEHLMMGLGTFLQPFPSVKVPNGKSAYALSQALGGMAMNQEMLSRVFSIVIDCIERSNSQLLPIYEPWKLPAVIDDTVKNYVKKRLFERGLDENGSPLTEEQMKEMVEAPVDQLFKVSREQVDQHASDQVKLDTLAAAVKQQMASGQVTPVTPLAE